MSKFYTRTPEAGNMPGPLRFLKESVRTGIDSVRQLVKNPRQWIPMLILSAFWLILSLLSAFGINSQAVRVLSFFTFAQGGMYNGMLGAIGGVIGKAVFAYFVSVLILPIFSRKNPIKGVGRGLKSFITGIVVKSANEAGKLVVGIGLALVMFNFFTGNASTVNSMAGV
ncbi:MAG: hypothetical protein Q8N36_02665, partial [bacterium]|nr:hypothetical protein [bacterium]